MISCKQVYQTASDYLEAPPGVTSRVMLRIHLMMCKHCRRYVHQLRISSDAAAQMEKPSEPDDEEIDRLVARLKDTLDSSR